MLIAKRTMTILGIMAIIVSVLSGLTPTTDSRDVNAVTSSGVPEKYSSGLLFEPFSFKIKLKQGELYKGVISITNTSEKVVTARTSINPYTNVGPSVDYNIETSESDIVDWTSILNNQDSEITFEIGETKTIGFVIDTPKDARIGGTDRSYIF